MKVIQISRLDNVAVALHPIKKGEEVTAGGITVTALEDIPQGHKIALKPIKNGENIIKYGFAIGHATADAEAGAWMHTHNVKTNLEGEMEYTYTPSLDFPEKVEPETFMGFRRKDGRAAIRNEIWIIPTVAVSMISQRKWSATIRILWKAPLTDSIHSRIRSAAARQAQIMHRQESFLQPLSVIRTQPQFSY